MICRAGKQREIWVTDKQEVVSKVRGRGTDGVHRRYAAVVT
jgi:hypothetical protein